MGQFSYAAPEDKPDPKKQNSLIQLEMKKSKEPPVKRPAILQNQEEETLPEEREKFFFGYQSAISLRTGGALNFKELKKDDGDKRIPILLGMNVMLKSENSKHQEYGFDLLTGKDSVLYIRGGYKYIIDHTSDFRPYYKIGAAMRFDQGDHLETPFDIKSYSIVASAGLEDLTSDPNSLRVDFDIYWGPEDFLGIVALGWSYAF